MLRHDPQRVSPSEILGSTPGCGSPRLIAACHVRHRLLAPRHPPCTLSSLTAMDRVPATSQSSSTASLRIEQRFGWLLMWFRCHFLRNYSLVKVHLPEASWSL